MESHNIVQMTNQYLHDYPEPWFDVANRLSKKIIALLKRELTDSEFLPYSIDSLQEDLLSELVSPTTIHLLRGANDSSNAIDTLIQVIFDYFIDNPVEAQINDLAEETIIIDFAYGFDGNYPVLDWKYGDREGIPTYKSISHAINIDILKNLILKELSKLNQPPNTSSLLYRLEIVDINLYQVLQTHPELLRTLDWRIFEKLLADILDQFGFEVELQRGTKDGGVDLFAIHKTAVFGEQRFLLQAKRWSNRVGIEPVRQLAFLHNHYRATKSCLATTSTFTSGAWELAQQYRYQMELRDFDGIHEWIRHVVSKK